MAISEPAPPDDVVADDEEDSDAGGSSALGKPGVSWRGDGALGAGRAQLRAMDPDQETFQPAVEEQSGYPLATFQRRWMGFILDELIVIGMLLVVLAVLRTFVSRDPEVLAAQMGVAAELLRVGYGLIFNHRGWSPGKKRMGLRIVRLDGTAPGTRHGIVRTAGAVLSRFFFVGYVWAAFDPKTQTLHDKLAGTYIVRVDQGVEGGAHTGWKRRER